MTLSDTYMLVSRALSETLVHMEQSVNMVRANLDAVGDAEVDGEVVAYLRGYSDGVDAARKMVLDAYTNPRCVLALLGVE